MAKKSVSRRTGRGSDQFIVRLPSGMRDTIAKLAANRDRSMNQEILAALTLHIELSKGAADDAMMLSEIGLIQMSKRFQAAIEAFEKLYFEVRDFDVRDIELDAFMADRRKNGVNLTRGEAIRSILRLYLEEHGFVDPASRTSPPAA